MAQHIRKWFAFIICVSNVDGTKLFTLFTPKTGCWHVKPRNKSGVPLLADPKITKPKCWDEWKPVETSGNHWPVDHESLHCSRKQDDVGWRCLNSGQNEIATFSSNETRGETPWFHSGMQLRTPMWYSSGGWGLQVNWYNRTKLYIPALRQALAWSLGENIARWGSRDGW